jgi:hypothetical protein
MHRRKGSLQTATRKYMSRKEPIVPRFWRGLASEEIDPPSQHFNLYEQTGEGMALILRAWPRGL